MESLKSDTEAISELKGLLIQELQDAAKASTIMTKALREGGEFLLENLGENKAEAPLPASGPNLSTPESSAEPPSPNLGITQDTGSETPGSDISNPSDNDVQPTKFGNRP